MLAFPIRLALGASLACLGCFDVLAADERGRGGLGVLSQSAGLPKEFNEHFFDVPLAVRVDLDGQLLGEALVVLGRNEHLQLLEFTDTSASDVSPGTRQVWMDYLAEPKPLGNCLQACSNRLVAMHYSLVNSQLSILTQAAERDGAAEQYHQQPELGSRGLIVRNQLNVVGGGSDTTGRYALQGQGSVGNWTTLAEGQVDRNSMGLQKTRHRVDQLYAERLVENNFYRLGYFTPNAAGLVRQPRLMGSSPQTSLGLMFGSSDSLALDSAKASTTPIYVTPNRPGMVEVYRDGQLINSQAVQPGLQTLDTTVLPGGIYDVEVRLVEDGVVTSTRQEFIYKPTSWRNPDQPWRYTAFLGRQEQLLSNWEDEDDAELTAGLMVNYLLHPRAIAGASVQRVDAQQQYGLSIDWEAMDRLKMYGNVFQTQTRGYGYDGQALWRYDTGNLALTHSRSWQQYTRTRRQQGQFVDYYDWRDRDRGQEVTQTSVSWYQQMDHKNSATLRVSQSSGSNSGTSLDLGWAYHGQVLGSAADWRLSLFDRPGSASTGDERNRGVSLALSMSLGGPSRRLSATLGSRTSRDGARDQNASLNYQQDVQYGAVRSLGAGVTADRYGAGLSANGQFQNSVMLGDAYLQNSSYNGELSGGLNLESTLAVGGGHMAISGEFQRYDAGLIVDVETDIPDLELRADSAQGLSAALRPGRNIVPVGAWKPGNVQFDFESKSNHAAVIQPSSLPYHLNRGGVAYRQVRIMRTVTVLGRLLDASGKPLKGAMVINHASRSVSEADGFFAVEMSESTPTLQVRHHGKPLCFLRLDEKHAKREKDVLLVGDQACVPEELARQGLPSNEEGA